MKIITKLIRKTFLKKKSQISDFSLINKIDIVFFLQQYLDKSNHAINQHQTNSCVYRRKLIAFMFSQLSVSLQTTINFFKIKRLLLSSKNCDQ